MLKPIIGLALAVALTACSVTPEVPSAPPTKGNVPPSPTHITPTKLSTPPPSPTTTPRIHKTVDIVFNLDGWNETLNIRYYELEDGRRVLRESDLGHQANMLGTFYPTADSEKYIWEEFRSLYLLDMGKLTFEYLLMPESGQYKWADITKSGCEWGASPQISPDGTKMVFNTTRNGVDHPERTDWPRWESDTRETWLKDLTTGEETMLVGEYLYPLWWGADNQTLYFEKHFDNDWQINNFMRIDIYGKNPQVLLENVRTQAFNEPYAWFTQGDTGLSCYDVRSGTVTAASGMAELLSDRVFAYNEWAVVYYLLPDDSTTRHTAVINAETGEFYTPNKPDDDTKMISVSYKESKGYTVIEGYDDSMQNTEYYWLQR